MIQSYSSFVYIEDRVMLYQIYKYMTKRIRSFIIRYTIPFQALAKKKGFTLCLTITSFKWDNVTVATSKWITPQLHCDSKRFFLIVTFSLHQKLDISILNFPIMSANIFPHHLLSISSSLLNYKIILINLCSLTNLVNHIKSIN